MAPRGTDVRNAKTKLPRPKLDVALPAPLSPSEPRITFKVSHLHESLTAQGLGEGSGVRTYRFRRAAVVA